MTDLVAHMKNAGFSGTQWRGKLLFEGVCTHCAHCRLTLTDPISVEAGMGPICRGKGGYDEPAEGGDEMLALGALGAWPELVEFLVQKYKPQGNRALMQGMVRIASLNRKSPVHSAITDALDLLGYKNLASVLRKSLCVVSIKESEQNPSHYIVWVKKVAWDWSWNRDVKREFPMSYFSRAEKGMVVPKEGKRQVWNLIIQHFEGLVLETPEGKFVRIERSVKKSDPPPAEAP